MGEGLSHWSSMVLRKSQTCFFDRHTHRNSMYSNFCHVLKKISNVLSKKTAEEKAHYFKSMKFMRWWVDAVAGLIQHWYSIEENITSNVQTKRKEDS